MAKGEIKTKLVLEGEAEYKRQMTDAANAVKVLDSEQKLAEAQFKATGDAQQYAADQARILKEKMAEQQKAVQAAEAAVQKLTDNGVDKNSKSMQTWNTRLNTAKARLLNMETQLNNTESELADQKTAVEGVSGAYEGMDGAIQTVDQETKFQNMIAALNKATEILGGAIEKVKEFSQWLYNSEQEAATWADNLETAASQAGVDAETYQSWTYASQFIDTEVSAIISHREKLTKRLTSSTEEDAKAFNALGVVTRESNGDVRDATDVFWDCIDALHNIEDPTERAKRAQDIFGTSWRDLQPLIEAGSKGYKDLADEGRQYATVAQEDVDKLSALDDSHNRLVSTMQATENTLRAQIAPAFTALNDAVTSALQKFEDWARTPEGQEALNKLGEAAMGLVESITNVDLEGVVNLATNAITGLTDALAWIGDHGEWVAAMLGLMGAGFVGLKVGIPVLQFLHLAKEIKWDSMARAMASGSGGAGGAAGAAGEAANAASGTAAAAAAAGGSWWSVLGAGAVVGGTAYLAKKAVERRKGDQSLLVDTAEHVQAAAQGNNVLYQALTDMVHAQKQMEDSFTEYANGNLSEDDYNAIIDRANALAETFHAMEGSSELWDAWQSWHDGSGISDWLMPEDIGEKLDEAAEKAEEVGQTVAEAQNALGELAAGAEKDLSQYDPMGVIPEEELQKLVDESKKNAESVAEAFKQGVDAKAPDVQQAAQDMGQAAVDETEQEMSFMETVGADAAQGLANGLYSRQGEVQAAANALAQTVQETMSAALDIHSPSRVMERLGGYVTEGFALGIERQIAAVDRAISGVVGAATAPAVYAPAAGGYRAAAGGQKKVVLMIDKHVLGEAMAEEMDGQMGALIENRR